MYGYEERKRAVEEYIRQDFNARAAIRELRYPALDAADKIDQGIAKCKPAAKTGAAGEGVPAPGAGTRQRPAFEPYKGKIRKPGSGA